MARPATDRDVRFYGCAISAAVMAPHWASFIAFAIAGWTLFLDIRDAYRDAEKELKEPPHAD